MDPLHPSTQLNAAAGPLSQAAPAPAPGYFAIPAAPAPRALKSVAPSIAPTRYPKRERTKANYISSDVIDDLSGPVSGGSGSLARHSGTRKNSVKIRINRNDAHKDEVYRSFMRGYNRELDQDPNDPIMFEEQFVLRVPEEVAMGDKDAGIKGLAELVNAKREIPGVSLRFKDQRRATFTHANKTYAAKLVDLPTITEGLKTIDRKRIFKVADICQMIVVQAQINSEQNLPQPTGDPEEYRWPHGLTPPLQHVRKRRFRQRVVRLDPIGDAVDKLLQADAEAESVIFSIQDGFPPTHQRGEPALSEAEANHEEDGRSVSGSGPGGIGGGEYGSTPGTPYESATTPGGTAVDFDDTRSVMGTEADEGEMALEEMLNGAETDIDEDGGKRDSDMEDDEDDEGDEDDDDDLFGDDEEEEEVDEELHGWQGDLKALDESLKEIKNAYDKRNQGIANDLLRTRDKTLVALSFRIRRAEGERTELATRIEERQATRAAARQAVKDKRAAEQAERNEKIARDAAERAGAQPARSTSGTAGRAGQVPIQGPSGSQQGQTQDQDVVMGGGEDDAEGEDDNGSLFGKSEDDDVDMEGDHSEVRAKQGSPTSSDGSSPGQPLAQQTGKEEIEGTSPMATAVPDAAPAAAPRNNWGFELDEEEEEY